MWDFFFNLRIRIFRRRKLYNAKLKSQVQLHSIKKKSKNGKECCEVGLQTIRVQVQRGKLTLDKNNRNFWCHITHPNIENGIDTRKIWLFTCWPRENNDYFPTALINNSVSICFHVVHLSVTYWCSFFMDCHETAGVELYQNCFLS